VLSVQSLNINTGFFIQRNELRQVHGYPDMNIEDWVGQDDFVPRYNIAPHSQAPVLRRREMASSATGANESSAFFLQTMRWGLVPHWAKHDDRNRNTINARSENLVAGGGMWAPIKGKKRCIVLAQGYVMSLDVKAPNMSIKYQLLRVVEEGQGTDPVLHQAQGW
jgi:putative SOS response-associated peptidase YedK